VRESGEIDSNDAAGFCDEKGMHPPPTKTQMRSNKTEVNRKFMATLLLVEKNNEHITLSPALRFFYLRRLLNLLSSRNHHSNLLTTSFQKILTMQASTTLERKIIK
jgi:hypothetical protein